MAGDVDGELPAEAEASSALRSLWRAQWRQALLWIVVATLVLAVVILLYSTAPDLYPNPPIPGDPPEVTAARDAAHTQAVVTTRASVLAALAGAGALVTIIINYRNSRTQARAAEAQGRAAEAQARAAEVAARGQEVAARTLEVTQETFRVNERGHLTDRYAKAIEQLGNEDSIAIRLGGIYALQQLAVDTTRDSDQAAVVEVLSAFVRLNLLVGLPESRIDQDSPANGGPSRQRVSSTRPAEPRADVLAAISTLAQLPVRPGASMRADFTGLDFTGVDLSHARLLDACLTSTNLSGATLLGADFAGANLAGAELIDTDLRGADLRGTDLRGTRLVEAALSFADLRGADLRGADLRLADVSDANLAGADLARANFAGADLARANFAGADLTDVDLAGAHLTPADDTDDDLADATLVDTEVVVDTKVVDTEHETGLTDLQLRSVRRRPNGSPGDLDVVPAEVVDAVGGWVAGE